MSDHDADAFVFLGATGDLAFEQIFPALQALTQRGDLNMPVVGVAKPDWTLEQLRARARDSITTHGSLDSSASSALAGRLAYVAVVMSLRRLSSGYARRSARHSVRSSTRPSRRACLGPSPRGIADGACLPVQGFAHLRDAA